MCFFKVYTVSEMQKGAKTKRILFLIIFIFAFIQFITIIGLAEDTKDEEVKLSASNEKTDEIKMIASLEKIIKPLDIIKKEESIESPKILVATKVEQTNIEGCNMESVLSIKKEALIDSTSEDILSNSEEDNIPSSSEKPSIITPPNNNVGSSGGSSNGNNGGGSSYSNSRSSSGPSSKIKDDTEELKISTGSENVGKEQKKPLEPCLVEKLILQTKNEFSLNFVEAQSHLEFEFLTKIVPGKELIIKVTSNGLSVSGVTVNFIEKELLTNEEGIVRIDISNHIEPGTKLLLKSSRIGYITAYEWIEISEPFSPYIEPKFVVSPRLSCLENNLQFLNI